MEIHKTPLTIEQRNDLVSLLLEFHDVFALRNEELGTTHLIEHSIETGDSLPYEQFPHWILHSLRGHMKELLNNMLAKGVIEPTHSPWASPEGWNFETMC